MQTPTFAIRPIVLAISVLVASTSALAQPATNAPPAAQRQAIDIPSLPAAQALQQLVEQTKLQLIYSPEVVRGVTTKPVSGTMSPKDALARMLEGTGLQPVDTGVNAATIRPTGVAQAQDDVLKLPPVVVTGVSHLGSVARTGLRADVDPMTLPQSITTISGEMLNQQQAVTLGDMLANTAGVQVTNDNIFQIRGFNAGVLRNGTLTASGISLPVPLMTIDKIEVIKGPESIIAGQFAGYGGVINIITKAPQAKPVADVSAQFGPNSRREVALDLGGALNEDKTLTGRLVLDKLSQGSDDLGIRGSSRDYFAPSLGYRNRSTGTEVVVSYEYNKQYEKARQSVYFDTSTQTLNDSLRPVRVSFTDPGTDEKETTAKIAITQRLWEGWSAGLQVQKERYDANGLVPFSRFRNSPNPRPFVYPDILTNNLISFQPRPKSTVKLELHGDFETGPVEHKLLLAYDDMKTTVSTGGYLEGLTSTNLLTGVVTDQSAIFTSIFGPLPGPVQFRTPNKQHETGVLLLDQMTWGKWVGVFGLRQIKYKSEELGATVDELNVTLPSLGLVYRHTPELSFYGSASKGFQPNSQSLDFTGQPLPPERAQQFELGFKSLMMDKKVALTAALFKIHQENVADFDPAHPCFCFVTIPGVTSKGFDVELSGKVTPNLDLRVSYTHNIVRTSTGAPIFAFAKDQGSIWATYRFLEGAMSGFWVGGGLQARSAARTHADPTAGDIYSPAAMRIDLNAGYQTKNWSVTAGVKNVTDRRNYTLNSGSFGRGTIDQVREFYLSGRYSFL